ncbi:MAG: chorismate mutase, partial [Oscillospiraceae bacterium]|nr:chorismate mutase [Oscillospiraceae bacterium]
MDELQGLRREIDGIDRQIVELFRQRMDVTRRVGEYKRARNLPVLDQERERQVLQDKGELAG